ncbi:hypothetical protein FW778_12525 [Ginsengibacter hankyongi]|uniref:Uncharacterized protein n=1 Tax=Ginsengibacter hankyongi TaxID=2607284 RepID=A0A5J5IGB6_9BACT|nr:hypothetical protein [Ginsengibacter hankyongi]KAA9038391.1 hypothetical protein FW778_12525 [Ginsengibacter hankyongi]
MKKLFFLIALSAGLLVISSQNAAAQKGILTSKTATKSNGYTILNPGETIMIYKYIHAAHSPKEAEKHGPKYFFTTPSSDTLKELTKMNLKYAFPQNHAFHDALDANFNTDAELTSYDAFHKIYKINRLYSNSVKM